MHDFQGGFARHTQGLLFLFLPFPSQHSCWNKQPGRGQPSPKSTECLHFGGGKGAPARAVVNISTLKTPENARLCNWLVFVLFLHLPSFKYVPVRPVSARGRSQGYTSPENSCRARVLHEDLDTEKVLDRQGGDCCRHGATRKGAQSHKENRTKNLVSEQAWTKWGGIGGFMSGGPWGVPVPSSKKQGVECERKVTGMYWRDLGSHSHSVLLWNIPNMGGTKPVWRGWLSEARAGWKERGGARGGGDGWWLQSAFQLGDKWRQKVRDDSIKV